MRCFMSPVSAQGRIACSLGGVARSGDYSRWRTAGVERKC